MAIVSMGVSHDVARYTIAEVNGASVVRISKIEIGESFDGFKTKYFYRKSWRSITDEIEIQRYSKEINNNRSFWRNRTAFLAPKIDEPPRPTISFVMRDGSTREFSCTKTGMSTEVESKELEKDFSPEALQSLFGEKYECFVKLPS